MELELALNDMRGQSELYRPTVFWDAASTTIVGELAQQGVGKFRSMPCALNYFVPTYGVPGNSFDEQAAAGLVDWIRQKAKAGSKAELALGQFLKGEMAAHADYRVLLAADDPTRLPHLHTFTENGFGDPVEQFHFGERRFSRSSLNYLLGLSLLKKHTANAPPRRVLEIGGGFGTLGEILSFSGIQGWQYIDVDIPPVSFVAQNYLVHVLGPGNVATYAQTRDRPILEIGSLPQASVLCSWQIEKLAGTVDLFVNFISFQEMEPHIVRNYLDQVTRLGARWVLLRNMREGKQLKGSKGSLSGVETPILSEDYLAMLPGYELVERNVNPFGYRTVDGFHSELLVLRRKE